MVRYVKLAGDLLQRKNYDEKVYRRKMLRYFLGNKNGNTKRCKFKSYCFINGSPRSVYSRFSLSRWFFKKYANFGYMSGIRTSSW